MKAYKRLIVFCLALIFGLSATVTYAASYVRGYYRSNGSYVNSYYRSSPNSYRYDNYSTKGNYNPYTGKAGTKSYFKW